MLSSLSGITGFLLLFGGVACALLSVSSWVTAVRLIVVLTLFGGIVALHIGSGAIMIIFRDVFLVLPLYIAFLASPARLDGIARMPAEIGLGLIFVVGYMGLATLNTNATSLLQVAIGLKVWLFYIPFLAIGLALAARPNAMLAVFRTLLICGTIACLIGLAQSLLVRLIGYQATMSFFFGSKASDVTQHFAWFQDAGGIYRIPGTFTFVTQYTNFLYLLLTVAAVESNADPNPRNRNLARVVLYLAALALILSGSRATGLTVTAFFAAYFLFNILQAGTLTLAPIALIGGLALLQIIGFDPAALFSTGGRLLGFYSRTLVFQSVQDAIQQGAFGAGIGSSTNAARYGIVTAARYLGYESFYGKVAAELGVIGLMLMASFFLMLLIRISSEALKCRRHASNMIVAPIAIYLAYNIVTLFKGSTLDQDPANIFFWLLLGVVLGARRTVLTSALISERASVVAAVPVHPAE